LANSVNALIYVYVISLRVENPWYRQITLDFRLIKIVANKIKSYKKYEDSLATSINKHAPLWYDELFWEEANI
jgi:hypothetical protein